MSASRSCVVPRSRVFFESGWARVCLAQSSPAPCSHSMQRPEGRGRIEPG